MHRHFRHSYSAIASPLHRVPAAAKMVVAVGMIVVLVTVPPSPILFAAVGLGLMLAAVLSRVPGWYIARRVLLLEPFVLGVAVLTLFGPNGPWMFLLVVLRTTLCILSIVLLANTTRFSDMLVVLRSLRVPLLIVTTLALMYRYLYVLKDEADRMKRARTCRTYCRTRGRAWQGLATVIAHLFVRSSERAERIYAAMCARGWR